MSTGSMDLASVRDSAPESSAKPSVMISSGVAQLNPRFTISVPISISFRLIDACRTMSA